METKADVHFLFSRQHFIKEGATEPPLSQPFYKGVLKTEKRNVLHGEAFQQKGVFS
jgi:hypothetical protein